MVCLFVGLCECDLCFVVHLNIYHHTLVRCPAIAQSYSQRGAHIIIAVAHSCVFNH